MKKPFILLMQMAFLVACYRKFFHYLEADFEVKYFDVIGHNTVIPSLIIGIFSQRIDSKI